MATRLSGTGARNLGRATALLAALVVLAGCGATRHGPTYPPAGASPAPAGAATDAARLAVAGALGRAGLQLADASEPYVPPQGPWFAAAPRTVVQVTLPGEAEPRFIALYAFGSAADAATAARDEAAYLSNGPGRVYVPIDARITLRVLGSVVVLFIWSPANAAGAGAQSVQSALETVGTGIAIPA